RLSGGTTSLSQSLRSRYAFQRLQGMGRRLGFRMATACSEPPLALPRSPFLDRDRRRRGVRITSVFPTKQKFRISEEEWGDHSPQYRYKRMNSRSLEETRRTAARDLPTSTTRNPRRKQYTK